MNGPRYLIEPSGDYLQVTCANCGDVCKFDYKGLDPSVPLIEITCPKCGSSGEWKLDRAGMGFYEMKTDDRTTAKSAQQG
jgi:ribosomal protein S27E